MLSFHNDPAIKAQYIARVRKHRIADNLIQGQSWDNGKGCAIGCTLESYNHARYPIELGIPEWLAFLEDKIFEGLPKAAAMKWPERFLNGVPVGVDLNDMRHKLAIVRLTRLADFQEKSIGDQWGVVAAIRGAIAYHRAPSDSAADSAARSAARSAWSAADSAAWSAARSAWSAAWSAADSAAWSQEADDVIELLESYKP